MSNAKRMAKLLNELLDLDPQALCGLLNQRQIVSGDVCDHPTVQVLVQDGFPLLGFLGLINGFLLQTGETIVVLNKPKRQIFRDLEDFYARDLKFETRTLDKK